MPGVTVEAASDVLIEKVKSAISDGNGSYRIADLRPGGYSVTFTLTGFKTYKRDGLQLPSEFTATLNAELAVGTLEETITVTGASPVVDVTSAAKTSVLDREAIDLIPTGRTIQGMAQLVVGVTLSLPDTGGARARQQTYMSTHGMSTANTTVLVDGQMTNGLQGDGAIQSYYNDAMNAEMSYQTAAIGAETSSGGVRLNMIPREGGNQFHGDFKAAHRPGTWQSSNLTDRHLARGLKAGNGIDRIIDYTVSLGGPIMKDKISGAQEIGYGINVSLSFQNNSSPNSSRVMTVTRNTTRYPANCPPCPAGQVIMPSADFPGQATLTYNLQSVRATAVERIVQLDLKVARTFRFGRFQVLPTFEAFNINNSDAIISYITTNILSSSYLAPNSIMQGRMYGFGVVTRW